MPRTFFPRTFGGGGGGAIVLPATPTITLNGQIVTVSGSSAGSTNTIYAQPAVTGSTSSPGPKGVRTGDGDVALNLAPGAYWIYCQSALTTGVAISNLVYLVIAAPLGTKPKSAFGFGSILRQLTPFVPFTEEVTYFVRVAPGGQQFIPYTLFRVQHLEEEDTLLDPVLAQSEMAFGVFETDLEQAGCPVPKTSDVIQRLDGTRWSVMTVSRREEFNEYALGCKKERA